MFSRHLHLAAALHALGPTADDVADTLDGGRWTGLPGDAMRCPIARNLTDVIPDTVGAAVSQHDATMFTADGGMTETVMPAGPAAFVDRFDDGAYRHLTDHSVDPDDPES